MNEVEQKIYSAIVSLRNLLGSLIDNVEDNEQLRKATEILSCQLQKTVGQRIIKDTLKNG